MKMKEFGPPGASLAPPWIRQCVQYLVNTTTFGEQLQGKEIKNTIFLGHIIK